MYRVEDSKGKYVVSYDQFREALEHARMIDGGLIELGIALNRVNMWSNLIDGEHVFYETADLAHEAATLAVDIGMDVRDIATRWEEV